MNSCTTYRSQICVCVSMVSYVAFCPYLFLTSNFSVTGRLYLVIAAFLDYLYLYCRDFFLFFFFFFFFVNFYRLIA